MSFWQPKYNKFIIEKIQNFQFNQPFSSFLSTSWRQATPRQGWDSVWGWSRFWHSRSPWWQWGQSRWWWRRKSCTWMRSGKYSLFQTEWDILTLVTLYLPRKSMQLLGLHLMNTGWIENGSCVLFEPDCNYNQGE